MKSAKIVKNRFFSRGPFFLFLYVTARCNARCKFCFYWDNIVNWRARPHLEVDEIEKISSRLDTLQQLTIGGGEPFLREELAEICTIFRKNCDVQFIKFLTHLWHGEANSKIHSWIIFQGLFKGFFGFGC